MSNEKKTYEAMFLVDGTGADFQAASQPIRKVLDRNEAEVLALKPWDDRRLAYEIKGRRRGLYALAYFKADPARIVEIERDCNLSEEIFRALVLHREHLSEEELKADTPISGVRRPEAAPAEDKVQKREGDAPRETPAEDSDRPADDKDSSDKDEEDDAAADEE